MTGAKILAIAIAALFLLAALVSGINQVTNVNNQDVEELKWSIFFGIAGIVTLITTVSF